MDFNTFIKESSNKSKMITTKVDPEKYEEVNLILKDKGRKFTEFLDFAMEEFLRQVKDK
ncbi:hypothetical protein HBN50_07735 [Halobacteriovorax sp. GB3]|uniref:hypothetical protein n=1 Tax=Halobacteriovorax sp. GB3 TaxID=2719615 RepID=UPI002362D257|nr:hypothetical protein [Halobacteriovorax sp. GB3]MDD0852982.1 hypothetical protein [Halobacteriovorax sp. GB3]